MNKVIYNGLTRGVIISIIHMECDTSVGLSKMSDIELVSVYKEIIMEAV
jgi:hypothetical protein